MPRMTQAEFAVRFTQLEPTFITGEASEEVRAFCKSTGLKHLNLPLKPLYGFDPIGLFSGKKTHHSWVGPDGLLEACKDFNVLETYELYHLFSGQAADAASELGIPLVCEVWTSFSKHPGYFIPPYSIAAKKVLQTTELFIARSKRAAKALGKLGVAENKIKVIYHGVNLEKFYPVKRKREDGKIRVLYVGVMSKYKGIDILLDIWPQVLEKYPKAELWLVGKGELLERAKRTKGTKVLGYIKHTEIPKMYRKADIFISPSRKRYLGPFLWNEEFFGYTLMEAQASGLPIIGTRCGGIPENIGNKNWVVPQNDKEALLSSLFAAMADDYKRIELGKNNRKRAARRYNLKKQVGKLERAILSL